MVLDAERAIDEAVDAEGVDISATARAIAEKRLGQLGDLPAKTLRRRLLGYLGRRGYGGWEVRELVDELLASREVG